MYFGVQTSNYEEKMAQIKSYRSLKFKICHYFFPNPNFFQKMLYWMSCSLHHNSDCDWQSPKKCLCTVFQVLQWLCVRIRSLCSENIPALALESDWRSNIKVPNWDFQCHRPAFPNPAPEGPPTLHVFFVSQIKHTWFNSLSHGDI